MARCTPQWPQRPREGGRHLLWVDPARDLVLASLWTEQPLDLIRAVTNTVQPFTTRTTT